MSGLEIAGLIGTGVVGTGIVTGLAYKKYSDNKKERTEKARKEFFSAKDRKSRVDALDEMINNN